MTPEKINQNESARNESVIKVLDEYLSLESHFEVPPEIVLSIRPNTPTDADVRSIAVSTAYQCYRPSISEIRQREGEKAEENARRTLEAGHFTTRQHVQYTWLIDGASRNVFHMLHDYPYYNSSQQSQRYVEVVDGSCVVPTVLKKGQEDFYREAASFGNKSYHELIELIRPEVAKRISTVYPNKWGKEGKTAESLEKRKETLSLEVARYVLPIGQKTTLYHSLSELQLLRLFHASKLKTFSEEAKFVVAKMISEVAKTDESILRELEVPMETNHLCHFEEKYIALQQKEFDEYLNGYRTRMKPLSPEENKDLARAIRNVYGLSSRYLTEKNALQHLLDPAANPVLADVYEIGIHDPLTRCLEQVNLTFFTKLSHTADSQRERHRMLPGTVPAMEQLYSGRADYITPMIIRENPKALSFYRGVMRKMFANVNRALDMGIPKDWALYLLPNAFSVRLTQSGNLLNFLHYWKGRTCFRAQEEIFFNALSQMQQFLDAFPEAKYIVQAICGVRKRAGMKPVCLEKDQWCGVDVFNLKLQDYEKRRLI